MDQVMGWLKNLFKKRKVIMSERKYVEGIDIYHGDDIVDWVALSKAIDFMFIKCTEGDYRVDPDFKMYREKAQQHKIMCGFYHFYRSNKDPIEQANDVIRVVGQLNVGDLPIVCDWETEDDPTDGNDISEVQKFLDAIEAHFKCVPIIYSGSSFASEKKLPASFTKYPLWVAHYTKSTPKIPRPWSTYTFWQNTDKAIVAGVKKPCDHNFFNGTKEELIKLCKI